jgi:hypothetical protein
MKTGLGKDPQDKNVKNEQAAKETEDGIPIATSSDIAQQIVENGSRLNHDQIMSIFAAYERIARKNLKEGNVIANPLMNLRPRISGSFTDVRNGFNSAAHKYTVDALPTLQAIEAIKTAAAKMLGVKVDEVYIKEKSTDAETGETSIYLSND